jgi:hypothetical protein
VKSLINTIFFLLYSLSYGQDWEWALQKGGSEGIDIAQDKWNNFYLIAQGNTPYGQFNLQTNTSGILAKHRNNGELLWANALGNVELRSLSVDKFSNCYVTGVSRAIGMNILYGTANSSQTVTESGNSDALLAKYDSTGKIIWALTWGFNKSMDAGHAIANDNEGNIYIAGINREETNFATYTNAFVRKYDFNGNLIWENNNNWKGDVYPRSIAVDSRGYCYVTGNYQDSGYFDNYIIAPNQKNHTIFLARYDINGQVLWAKKLGTNVDDCYAVCLGNESVYLAGKYTSPSTFESVSFNNGQTGSFVLKLDQNGNVKNGNSAVNSIGFDLTFSENMNKVVLTGQFKEMMQFTLNGNANQITTSKECEAFVAALDTNLILLWLMKSAGPGKSNTWSRSVAVDLDGNAAITGGFNGTAQFDLIHLTSPSTNNGINNESDIFLAKTNSRDILTDQSELNYPNFNLYPVPSSGRIVLEINSMKASNVRVFITSIENQAVYQRSFSSELKIEEIHLFELAKGLYFLCVEFDGQKQTRKIIIE